MLASPVPDDRPDLVTPDQILSRAALTPPANDDAEAADRIAPAPPAPATPAAIGAPTPPPVNPVDTLPQPSDTGSTEALDTRPTPTPSPIPPASGTITSPDTPPIIRGSPGVKGHGVLAPTLSTSDYPEHEPRLEPPIERYKELEQTNQVLFKQINKVAQETGVQPRDLAAIVYASSQYDPQHNDGYHVGLTGITSDDARWVDPDGAMTAQDPIQNLYMGAEKLKRLQMKFGNGTPETWAAYWAGPDHVEALLHRHPDDHQEAQIPGTFDFVNRVLGREAKTGPTDSGGRPVDDQGLPGTLWSRTKAALTNQPVPGMPSTYRDAPEQPNPATNLDLVRQAYAEKSPGVVEQATSAIGRGVAAVRGMLPGGGGAQAASPPEDTTPVQTPLVGPGAPTPPPVPPLKPTPPHPKDLVEPPAPEAPAAAIGAPAAAPAAPPAAVPPAAASTPTGSEAADTSAEGLNAAELARIKGTAAAAAATPVLAPGAPAPATGTQVGSVATTPGTAPPVIGAGAGATPPPVTSLKAGPSNITAQGAVAAVNAGGPNGLLSYAVNNNRQGATVDQGWNAVKDKMALYFIAKGDPVGGMHAQEYIFRLQHQGATENLQNAMASLQAGDLNGAAQYIAASHAFVQDGAMLQVHVLNGDTLVGQRYSEDTHQPIGSPFMIGSQKDQAALRSLLSRTTDPRSYMEMVNQERSTNQTIEHNRTTSTETKRHNIAEETHQAAATAQQLEIARLNKEAELSRTQYVQGEINARAAQTDARMRELNAAKAIDDKRAARAAAAKIAAETYDTTKNPTANIGYDGQPMTPDKVADAQTAFAALMYHAEGMQTQTAQDIARHMIMAPNTPGLKYKTVLGTNAKGEPTYQVTNAKTNQPVAYIPAGELRSLFPNNAPTGREQRQQRQR